MSFNILVQSVFMGFLCVLIFANVPETDSNKNVLDEGKNSDLNNLLLGLPNTTTSQTPVTTTESNNSTLPASTGGSFLYHFQKNGAILRAFYVVVGVTAIVIVYFVIRAVRLRRKRSKTRKYGIIAKSGDVEMTPLEQDDDDDDMTVFEIPTNHLIRK